MIPGILLRVLRKLKKSRSGNRASKPGSSKPGVTKPGTIKNKSSRRGSGSFLTAALSAVLLLAVAAALLLPGLSLPFVPDISLGSRSEVSQAHIILKEVRPLLSISTVEYTYKSVFPYDYFSEGTDYTRLEALDFSGKTPPPELEDELELYRLCREVGIKPGSGSYDFAVITARVKAGYDLSGAVPETESADTAGSDGEHPLSVRTEEEKGEEVPVISLPPPQITEFIIQDETSSRYEYPDIELTAGEWKRITGYVADRIRSRVEKEEITARAEQRAQGLIRSLFTESGFPMVRFE